MLDCILEIFVQPTWYYIRMPQEQDSIFIIRDGQNFIWMTKEE